MVSNDVDCLEIYRLCCGIFDIADIESTYQENKAKFEILSGQVYNDFFPFVIKYV